MSNRSKLIETFLEQSAWASWTRKPLAGDASARRYERLQNRNQSVILMDAPPENGEDTRPFARMAKHLADAGLCPPQILAHDAEIGIMILSDLGKSDFASWLVQHPTDKTMLYKAAVDVLIHLQDQPQPVNLQIMTPQTGGNMLDVTMEFYAMSFTTDLMAEMTQTLARLADKPDTLALRDYHAENLIWRSGEDGLNRVGLLDFQDAFVAPSGYDLASLLRDARRDLDPKTVEDMITYFISQKQCSSGFRAQLACLGAQRNLRILGVFARLAKKGGKTQYLRLIPRVWSNLMMDLNHPELSRLKSAVRDCLPAPVTNAVKELGA